jgi:hypothetical protein
VFSDDVKRDTLHRYRTSPQTTVRSSVERQTYVQAGTRRNGVPVGICAADGRREERRKGKGAAIRPQICSIYTPGDRLRRGELTGGGDEFKKFRKGRG